MLNFGTITDIYTSFYSVSISKYYDFRIFVQWVKAYTILVLVKSFQVLDLCFLRRCNCKNPKGEVRPSIGVRGMYGHIRTAPHWDGPKQAKSSILFADENIYYKMLYYMTDPWHQLTILQWDF